MLHGGGWGLVVFPVFKTAWGAVDPVLGGFDSHTLPPFIHLSFVLVLRLIAAVVYNRTTTGGAYTGAALSGFWGCSAVGSASQWH